MCVFLLSRYVVYASVWTSVCTPVCMWLLHLTDGVKFTSLSMRKQETGVWYWVSVHNLSLNFIPVHSESVSQKVRVKLRVFRKDSVPCLLHPGKP